MSGDKVILLQDGNGELYAIPVEKLVDAKLKLGEVQVQDAMKAADPSGYRLLGVADMPHAVRRASYVTPNVTANVLMQVVTA